MPTSRLCRAAFGVALVGLLGAGQARADAWLEDLSTGCTALARDDNAASWTIAWSGSCVEGKASGHGILVISDGKGLLGVYEGEMAEGKLQGGASHRITDIGNLEPLVTGHPTLLKTALAFCSAGQTHNNYWEFWVERVPGGVLLCRGPSPIDVGRWPLEQYAVSYLVDLVRMAAPRSWWPREISPSSATSTSSLSPRRSSTGRASHPGPSARPTGGCRPSPLLRQGVSL